MLFFFSRKAPDWVISKFVGGVGGDDFPADCVNAILTLMFIPLIFISVTLDFLLLPILLAVGVIFYWIRRK